MISLISPVLKNDRRWSVHSSSEDVPRNRKGKSRVCSVGQLLRGVFWTCRGANATSVSW